MLVGKIRNLFVESPLWLLGWLNHHHSWLSQNTNCHESHIQKSIQKSIQNTNLIKSWFWGSKHRPFVGWSHRGGFVKTHGFPIPTLTWRTWQTCPAFVADLPESVVAMGKSGVLGHHICILDEEALGGWQDNSWGKYRSHGNSRC